MLHIGTFANGVDARMELLGNDNARDTAVGDLMNWDSPIAPLYVHLMAGLNASDVTEQSAVDYMRSGFGRDYPVRGGLGSLVAKWGADIPVTLNCRVGAVNMTGRDVTVTSNHGDLRTKRVIITVSTGILAAGDILFTPALPDTVTTAIDHLPCGTLNKIGVALAPGAVPPDADGWHLSWPDHDMGALQRTRLPVLIFIRARPRRRLSLLVPVLAFIWKRPVRRLCVPTPKTAWSASWVAISATPLKA
jgi:hypothetical protein